MSERFLGLLGLARKGGFVFCGDEAAREAAQAGKSRLLLLAEDASANTKDRALRVAAEKPGVFVLTAPVGKALMGRTLGRASCAVCAVTDVGLAAALAEKLTQDGTNEQTQAAMAAERLALAGKRRTERRKRTLHSPGDGEKDKKKTGMSVRKAKNRQMQGKERGGLE